MLDKGYYGRSHSCSQVFARAMPLEQAAALAQAKQRQTPDRRWTRKHTAPTRKQQPASDWNSATPFSTDSSHWRRSDGCWFPLRYSSWERWFCFISDEHHLWLQHAAHQAFPCMQVQKQALVRKDLHRGRGAQKTSCQGRLHWKYSSFWPDVFEVYHCDWCRTVPLSIKGSHLDKQ